MDDKTTIEELKKLVVKFRDERDWKKYHNPKDLAADISIESAELQELFLWKNLDEIKKFTDAKANIEKIKDELADVVIACLLLADELGIDLSDSVIGKNSKNSEKYPIEKVKGNYKKYTEL